MSENIIWFKGELIPQSQAKVPVLSPTAQFGLNVFEGIRCYWNSEVSQLYAFRLREHFNRLQKSCKLLRISCPYTADELGKALTDSVRANNYAGDCAVRMTVFVDGEGSWSTESNPVEMFVAPISRNRTILPLTHGKSACVSSWERINDNSLPPRVKAGANYINGRYAHLAAIRDGYDLPIFLDSRGLVAEGAGACLFMVTGDTLITPPIAASILESITRDSILTFAEDLGLRVIERDISRTELYVADEIFFCGSAAEITPITSVDHYVVGTGNVGRITNILLKKYIDIVSGQVSEYMKWLTPIY